MPSTEVPWPSSGPPPRDARRPSAEGIAAAPDGSIYVTGSTSSFGAGDIDAFLIRYAADGTIVWQRTYGVAVQPGFTANEFGLDVAVAPDGTVLIAGIFGTDAFVAKCDASGTLLRERTWGGSINEFGRDVAVAPDGSVYVTGDGNSFFGNDTILVKFDPAGNVIWERDWRAGTIQDLSGGLGIAVAADGSVYMTGLANVADVGQDVFLVKLTPAGSLVWERTRGSGVDTALAVTTEAGQVCVSGNTGFGEGNGDAFVLRFMPNGKAKTAATWGNPDNEVGWAIAVGADGNLYVSATASSGPPFVFSRAGEATGTPTSEFNVPVGTVTTPGATIVDPDATVTTSSGSTVYAGGTEGVLLKLTP